MSALVFILLVACFILSISIIRSRNRVVKYDDSSSTSSPVMFIPRPKIWYVMNINIISLIWMLYILYKYLIYVLHILCLLRIYYTLVLCAYTCNYIYCKVNKIVFSICKISLKTFLFVEYTLCQIIILISVQYFYIFVYIYINGFCIAVDSKLQNM